jgi:hypothetical protein
MAWYQATRTTYHPAFGILLAGQQINDPSVLDPNIYAVIAGPDADAGYPPQGDVLPTLSDIVLPGQQY